MSYLSKDLRNTAEVWALSLCLNDLSSKMVFELFSQICPWLSACGLEWNMALDLLPFYKESLPHLKMRLLYGFFKIDHPLLIVSFLTSLGCQYLNPYQLVLNQIGV